MLDIWDIHIPYSPNNFKSLYWFKYFVSFSAPSSVNKHNDCQVDANNCRSDHRRYHRSQKREADSRRHHTIVGSENHGQLRNYAESMDLEVSALSLPNTILYVLQKCKSGLIALLARLLCHGDLLVANCTGLLELPIDRCRHRCQHGWWNKQNHVVIIIWESIERQKYATLAMLFGGLTICILKWVWYGADGRLLEQLDVIDLCL